MSDVPINDYKKMLYLVPFSIMAELTEQLESCTTEENKLLALGIADALNIHIDIDTECRSEQSATEA
jgi:hypothetical protein